MKLEDLKVTARLAHLGLSDDELSAALPTFEQMLNYFAVMQTADVLTAGTTGSVDIKRVHSDLVLSIHHNTNNLTNNFSANSANSYCANNPANHNENQLANNNLLNQANERNGNFIVVPNVL